MNFKKYLNLYFKKFSLKGRNIILITGASGFISKYLIHALLSLKKTNVKIIGVDNVKPNFSHKNFKFIKKDLTIGNLEKILRMYKLTHIINLAGIPSPTDYKRKPLETIYLNSELTKILLKYCKSKKIKLTYFSSSEIYGNPIKNKIPTDEKYNGNVSSIGPRSCYDESKRLGETYCYVYRKYFGVKCNIIRPFNIYGPGMKKNDERIIPNFINRVYKKKNLYVFDNGKQTRTYCHIYDATIMFLLIIFKGKDFAYNVGNPKEEISALKLAQKLKTICKSDVKIKLISYPSKYPEDEPRRRCPDIKKFVKEFKFRPKISLSNGIKNSYQNFLSQYLI